jgi:hypothetical protein
MRWIASEDIDAPLWKRFLNGLSSVMVKVSSKRLKVCDILPCSGVWGSGRHERGRVAEYTPNVLSALSDSQLWYLL